MRAKPCCSPPKPPAGQAGLSRLIELLSRFDAAESCIARLRYEGAVWSHLCHTGRAGHIRLSLLGRRDRHDCETGTRYGGKLRHRQNARSLQLIASIQSILRPGPVCRLWVRSGLDPLAPHARHRSEGEIACGAKRRACCSSCLPLSRSRMPMHCYATQSQTSDNLQATSGRASYARADSVADT